MKNQNYYLLLFKTAFKYLDNYKIYWFFLFLRFVHMAFAISLPVLLGTIINTLSQGELDFTKIATPTLIFLGILMFEAPLDNFSANRTWIYAWRAMFDFRIAAVKKFRHTDLSYWQENERGKVQAIIDKTFWDMIWVTGGIGNTYVPLICRIGGTLLVASVFDPVLAIILLIAGLLIILMLSIMVPKEEKKALIERKGHEAFTASLYEYLNNMRTVTYLQLFDRQEQELMEKSADSYQKYREREFKSTIKWYLSNQINGLTLACVFAYSLWQVFIGNLNIGQLTTIMIFVTQLTSAVGEIVWQLSNLTQYQASLRRFTEVVGSIEDKKNLVGTTKLNSFDELSIDGLTVKRNDLQSLTDITLHAKAGESIAIVGYTGSGKSTLIDVILKAIVNFKGTIKINGQNYDKLEVADIAGLISIVPQEVQLFRDSIRNNLTVASRSQGHSNQKIEDAIQHSMLVSLIDKLPKGLKSNIYENAANVSGGERQRIGIARALLQEHPILILDEATASLDPKTERQVVENIIKFYPEKTLLYITHKYALLNLFDKILVMDNGRIIESGSFETLVKKGGLFEDLYKASQLQ